MATSSKKSANPPTSYSIGDTVLAKIKGYPPWPARIVDPETVSKAVIKDRPKSSKTMFYCVRFYPAGDHAWQVPKDMSKLLPHEIDAYINEPSKKNGELLQAYKIAKDPAEWDSEQEKLRKDAEEAEKNAPFDELEEDEELEDDGTEKGSKKRKRDSDGEKKPKAKQPKKPKAASKSAEPTTPKPKKGRGKKNGVTSAPEIVESEDDGTGEGKERKDDSERPSKRAKRGDDDDDEDENSGDTEANKVKAWRHELQRTFLSKNGAPKAEDVSKASETFKAIEQFFPHLTVELLSSSKLGKVIKKIAALGEDYIPNGDEFKIRERAINLVSELSTVVNKAPNSSAGEVAPTTNGSAVPAEASIDAAAVVPEHDTMTEADGIAEPDVSNGDIVLPVAEPLVEPAAEPAVEPTAEPTAEPATETKAMQVDVPAVEPAAVPEEALVEAPTAADVEMNDETPKVDA